MLRNVALAEQHALFRVQSAGQEVNRQIAHKAAQLRAVMNGGERMVVRDEVIGLAFVLEVQGRLHHAKVVADVETTAGLKAG